MERVLLMIRAVAVMCLHYHHWKREARGSWLRRQEKGDLAWSLKASSTPINLFDLWGFASPCCLCLTLSLTAFWAHNHYLIMLTSLQSETEFLHHCVPLLPVVKHKNLLFKKLPNWIHQTGLSSKVSLFFSIDMGKLTELVSLILRRQTS